jgi:hypothetical protein
MCAGAPLGLLSDDARLCVQVAELIIPISRQYVAPADGAIFLARERGDCNG